MTTKNVTLEKIILTKQKTLDRIKAHSEESRGERERDTFHTFIHIKKKKYINTRRLHSDAGRYSSVSSRRMDGWEGNGHVFKSF